MSGTAGGLILRSAGDANHGLELTSHIGPRPRASEGMHVPHDQGRRAQCEMSGFRPWRVLGAGRAVFDGPRVERVAGGALPTSKEFQAQMEEGERRAEASPT